MKLYKSDCVFERIEIGNQILTEQSAIYTEILKEDMKSQIKRLSKNEQYEVEELLALAVYDYWLYGITLDEDFYLNFMFLSTNEKEKYLSHMDRINYMHYLNNVEDEHLLTNKYETYELLRDYYKRAVISIENESDYDTFVDFVSTHKEFVIKPLGLATSIGIRKVNTLEWDGHLDELFTSILDEINVVENSITWTKIRGVILEEVIEQGKELDVLHNASINSVRLTTINIDGNVHIFYPVLRIGKGNNFLCSGAVGSVLTGINVETGITETDGYNEWGEHFIVHPDSNIKIEGIVIPKWKELCQMAEELAVKFPTLRYIGWDFVWTKNNEWIVMEGNENGEFLGQIAYQKGLKEEFVEIIDWKSPKKIWWEGKYLMDVDLSSN